MHEAYAAPFTKGLDNNIPVRTWLFQGEILMRDEVGSYCILEVFEEKLFDILKE